MTFACIIPAMFLSEFELGPNIVITSLFYLNRGRVGTGLLHPCAACLAIWSAASLPTIPSWPGIKYTSSSMFWCFHAISVICKRK